jgi:hypothetical protein
MMSDLPPQPQFLIGQRNMLNALCFLTPIAL